MNTKIVGLLALIGFVISIGCGTAPKSPHRIAYTTLDSAGETADRAISAWADFVVIKQKQIEKLLKSENEEDKGKALELQNGLLKSEGVVSAAYYKYQDAYKAAVNSGAAGSEAPSELVTTLLGEFLSAIAKYQTP